MDYRIKGSFYSDVQEIKLIHISIPQNKYQHTLLNLHELKNKQSNAEHPLAQIL